jgi:hypothetical protein
MSYLIRAAVERLRQHRRALILVTYVNPNLGFTGATYRAANWTRLAREHGTHYSYVDSVYVTDRQLIARFGTADPFVLRERLGEQFQRSLMPLDPLDVYAFALEPTLRAQLVHNAAAEITCG